MHSPHPPLTAIIHIITVGSDNSETCHDTDASAYNTVASGSAGGSCSSYSSNVYCGNYDDDDFDSNTMCCACGGGTTSGHHACNTTTTAVHLAMLYCALFRVVTISERGCERITSLASLVSPHYTSTRSCGNFFCNLHEAVFMIELLPGQTIGVELRSRPYDTKLVWGVDWGVSCNYNTYPPTSRPQYLEWTNGDNPQDLVVVVGSPSLSGSVNLTLHWDLKSTDSSQG